MVDVAQSASSHVTLSEVWPKRPRVVGVQQALYFAIEWRFCDLIVDVDRLVVGGIGDEGKVGRGDQSGAATWYNQLGISDLNDTQRRRHDPQNTCLAHVLAVRHLYSK